MEHVYVSSISAIRDSKYLRRSPLGCTGVGGVELPENAGKKYIKVFNFLFCFIIKKISIETEIK